MGRNLYYEDEILEEKFNGFMFKRLLSYAAEYKWDYIKAAILLSGPDSAQPDSESQGRDQ